MDLFESLEIFDCPDCHGPGVLHEDHGWCVYVECMDCGSHTAELSFRTEEERETQAKQVVHLWNMGKVIHSGVGD